jgi:hypothetical protein
VWSYLHGNIAVSSGPIVATAMKLLIDTLLLVAVMGLCAWWWEGEHGEEEVAELRILLEPSASSLSIRTGP